jgi:hypothetical protein
MTFRLTHEGVGKTSLVVRYGMDTGTLCLGNPRLIDPTVDDKFSEVSPPTIGASLSTQKVAVTIHLTYDLLCLAETNR